jgi:hypothetical protein
MLSGAFWKLSQPWTDVEVGAPKYGRNTRSWRLYVKPWRRGRAYHSGVRGPLGAGSEPYA